MKHLYTTLIPALFTAQAFSQDPDILPDFFPADTIPTVLYRTNDGQVIDTDGDLRPEIGYVSEGSPLTTYFSKYAVSMVLVGRDTSAAAEDTLYRLDMYAAAEGDMTGLMAMHKAGGVNNYYLPHTAPGITGVPARERVVYPYVWPKIDWHFYSGSGGQKMALVCWPGADPEDIYLRFTGQDSLGIDVDGTLKAYLGQKLIKVPEAIAYQVDGGLPVPITWIPEYEIDGDAVTVHFFTDTYNTGLPLIFEIGPAPAPAPPPPTGNIDWSTMMGNTYKSDVINASDVDPDGSLYIAGSTNDDVFPAITGGIAYTAGREAFYGHYLLAPGVATEDAKNDWTTYIGGSDADKARAVLYDHATDVLFTVGWTESSNFYRFPSSDPADGTFWQGANKGGVDGFITQADPMDGTVLRSIYFGGEGDDLITGITEGKGGGVYITGATNTSTGSSGTGCTSPATGFPVCAFSGAYNQSSDAGQIDGFISWFTSNNYLLWSTYFGQAGSTEIP